jgi:HEAT repeat protein
LKEVVLISLLAVLFSCALGRQEADAAAYEPVKSLIGQIQTGDLSTKNEALRKLGTNEPKTHEDLSQLRSLFADAAFNETLFGVGMDAIALVKDPTLDAELIGILEDEQPLMRRVTKDDFAGRTERELKRRGVNVMFIIEKLGNFKSRNAAPVLKDYLNVQAFQYYASEALAKIEDKSAVKGGQGLDEAKKIVRDLNDTGKKDKWVKISGQLGSISNPAAKPLLRTLFSHEDDYVREMASNSYRKMVSKEDVNDIVEMAMNNDGNIKDSAIHAMMVLRDVQFDDLLLKMLKFDPSPFTRAKAARALGYKNVQPAVPALEKALSDRIDFVREEAFISLYVLTGKKYDFEGRERVVERKAEEQRKYPSIY